jgi:prepilin-type N-terminal cleavage/methylation domain-containing protein
MMGRARRRSSHPSRQAGFTLVEMAVALALSAIVAASFTGVIYSLSQNAGDAGRNADLQRTGRLVVAEMVIDLRQAEAVSPNGDPIESLSADRIVFYSDRDETEGPERIIYERTACAVGLCELRVTRYPAVAGSGPEWEFATAPFEEQVVMERVRNDQPLFRGATWTGTPATKTFVSACAGTCRFSLVVIRVRALPELTSVGAAQTLEITEEVELRNAG